MRWGKALRVSARPCARKVTGPGPSPPTLSPNTGTSTPTTLPCPRPSPSPTLRPCGRLRLSTVDLSGGVVGVVSQGGGPPMTPLKGPTRGRSSTRVPDTPT